MTGVNRRWNPLTRRWVQRPWRRQEDSVAAMEVGYERATQALGEVTA